MFFFKFPKLVPLHTVNRSAIILIRKQAFLDWANSVEPAADITLEIVNQEPSFYLLPDNDKWDAESYLKDFCYDHIFTVELSGWFTDPALWPAKRTWALFNDFFEFRLGSMVYDTDLSRRIKRRWFEII